MLILHVGQCLCNAFKRTKLVEMHLSLADKVVANLFIKDLK